MKQIRYISAVRKWSSPPIGEARVHLAFGDMGHNAELQLTVICDDESLALLSNKSVSDFKLVLLQSGLVLKIRSPSGQTASLRIEIQRTVYSRILVC